MPSPVRAGVARRMADGHRPAVARHARWARAASLSASIHHSRAAQRQRRCSARASRSTSCTTASTAARSPARRRGDRQQAMLAFDVARGRWSRRLRRASAATLIYRRQPGRAVSGRDVPGRVASDAPRQHGINAKLRPDRRASRAQGPAARRRAGDGDGLAGAAAGRGDLDGDRRSAQRRWPSRSGLRVRGARLGVLPDDAPLVPVIYPSRRSTAIRVSRHVAAREPRAGTFRRPDGVPDQRRRRRRSPAGWRRSAPSYLNQPCGRRVKMAAARRLGQLWSAPEPLEAIRRGKALATVSPTLRQTRVFIGST